LALTEWIEKINHLWLFSQEEKDETSKFEISVCDDFSGRWAFKSLSRGYFLGASG